jgi:hypothetical protein
MSITATPNGSGPGINSPYTEITNHTLKNKAMPSSTVGVYKIFIKIIRRLVKYISVNKSNNNLSVLKVHILIFDLLLLHKNH